MSILPVAWLPEDGLLLTLAPRPDLDRLEFLQKPLPEIICMLPLAANDWDPFWTNFWLVRLELRKEPRESPAVRVDYRLTILLPAVDSVRLLLDEATLCWTLFLWCCCKSLARRYLLSKLARFPLSLFCLIMFFDPLRVPSFGVLTLTFDTWEPCVLLPFVVVWV